MPSAGATPTAARRFFNALRDTTNDCFLATYRVGEPPPTAALERAKGSRP